MSNNIIRSGDLNQDKSNKSIFDYLSDFMSGPDRNYNLFLSKLNKKERIDPSFVDLVGTYFGVVVHCKSNADTVELVNTVYSWIEPTESKDQRVTTATIWVPEIDSVCSNIILPGQPGFVQEEFNKKTHMLNEFVKYGEIETLYPGDIVAVEYNDPKNPSKGGRILDLRFSRASRGWSLPTGPKDAIEKNTEDKSLTTDSPDYMQTVGVSSDNPPNRSIPYNLKDDDGWSDKFNVKGEYNVRKQKNYEKHLKNPSYGKIAILNFNKGLKWGNPEGNYTRNIKQGEFGYLATKGDGYNKEMFNYYQDDRRTRFTKSDARISQITMYSSPVFKDAIEYSIGKKENEYILHCHKYVELPLRMALREIKLKVEKGDFEFKVKTTDTNINRKIQNPNLEEGYQGFSAHHWGVSIDLNGFKNPYVHKDYVNNNYYKFSDNNGDKFENANDVEKVKKAVMRDYHSKSGFFDSEYTITKEVVAIFGHYGWIWGGIWPKPDIMHFAFFGDPEKAERAYYKGFHNVIVENIDEKGKYNSNNGKKQLADLVITGGSLLSDINARVQTELQVVFGDLLPQGWQLHYRL